jgi:hypothetical protein
MLDGMTTTTCTNTEIQPLNQKCEVKSKPFFVARLNIYKSPGWFDIQSFDNLRDADIYCLMLNQDTEMIHRVFMEDDSDV